MRLQLLLTFRLLHFQNNHSCISWKYNSLTCQEQVYPRSWLVSGFHRLLASSPTFQEAVGSHYNKNHWSRNWIRDPVSFLNQKFYGLKMQSTVAQKKWSFLVEFLLFCWFSNLLFCGWEVNQSRNNLSDS